MNETINIFTFLWGTKYSTEYVNNLHNSLNAKLKRIKFDFYCITDNIDQLFNKNINVIDINQFLFYRNNLNNEIFTSIKCELFKTDIIKTITNKTDNYNLIIDIDCIILNDFSIFLTYEFFEKGKFIKNSWGEEKRQIHTFHKGDCFVNSSFVSWKNDDLLFIYEYLIDNTEILKWKFQSFDKFLYYIFYDKLNFVDQKNFITTYKYNNNSINKDFFICLFNTSDTVGGTLLHESDECAKNLWRNEQTISRIK